MYKQIIKRAPINNSNLTGLTQFQKKLDKITPIVSTNNIYTIDYSSNLNTNDTLYLGKPSLNDMILDVINLSIPNSGSIVINIYINTISINQHVKKIKINGTGYPILVDDLNATLDNNVNLVLQQITLLCINSQIFNVLSSLSQFKNNYSGLRFNIYNKYMNDDIDFFKNNVPINNENGYSTNFLNITTATNNIIKNGMRDNYSIEWYGYFIPSESGTWNITLGSDDCSYLWLGDNAETQYTKSNVLISLPGGHAMLEKSNTIILVKDDKYPIRLHYGESIYDNNITLSFTSPSNVIYQKNIPFYTYDL